MNHADDNRDFQALSDIENEVVSLFGHKDHRKPFRELPLQGIAVSDRVESGLEPGDVFFQ